ncbi:pyruvate formate lyase family protein [Mailhella sp.]|uniref:pyruvate formate lyase family protein n=1 Tax=Mailhella sp. TaxID=1981029 RepID=UPI004063E690
MEKGTIKNERVQKRLDRWFDTPWRINIEHAKAYTRGYALGDGEAMVVRRAMAFAHCCETMPVIIHDEDYLVGYRDVDVKCAGIFPEWSGPEFFDDMATIKDRTSDRFEFDPEDERILLEEVKPYWEYNNWSRTMIRQIMNYTPDFIKNTNFADASCFPPVPANICGHDHRRDTDPGHIIFPADRYLYMGAEGVKKQAEEKLASVDTSDPKQVEGIPFWRAVIIGMDGAITYANRFAAEAERQAAECADPKRRQELLEIAETCRRVPAKPARTMHEALQAYVFFKTLCRIESIDHASGPSRIDRWLFPFYDKDIKEGRITNDDALALLEEFYIWLAESSHYYTSGVLSWYSGAASFHLLTVGGVDQKGRDSTNDLSYLCLDAYINTNLFQPSMCVRVHSQSPQKFLEKVGEVVALGGGQPSIVNDEAFIPALLALPRGLNDPDLTIELAREYCPVGCSEPSVPTHYGCPMHSYINYGALIELALNRGESHLYKRRMIASDPGDAREFTSMDDVLKALDIVFKDIMDVDEGLVMTQEQVEREFYPTVWQSAFMEDCVERGLAKENGGARYNYGGPGTCIGYADAGDSLAAIEQVIFIDKKYTMKDLCDALDANFEGWDDLRKALQAAPKFGSDNDQADKWCRYVHDLYNTSVVKRRNRRGGALMPGAVSMSVFVPHGEVCGALPSGRKAGEALANGVGATIGAESGGLLASFNSQGKIDFHNDPAIIWNVRVEGGSCDTLDGRKDFANLVRVFVDKKIAQMQVNCLSSDIMRKAQQDPEKYRDLIVRVVGYSANFVTLPDTVQELVIQREEHPINS